MLLKKKIFSKIDLYGYQVATKTACLPSVLLYMCIVIAFCAILSCIIEIKWILKIIIFCSLMFVRQTQKQLWNVDNFLKKLLLTIAEKSALGYFNL